MAVFAVHMLKKSQSSDDKLLTPTNVQAPVEFEDIFVLGARGDVQCSVVKPVYILGAKIMRECGPFLLKYLGYEPGGNLSMLERRQREMCRIRKCVPDGWVSQVRPEPITLPEEGFRIKVSLRVQGPPTERHGPLRSHP
jgi:hypothetical protein